MAVVRRHVASIDSGDPEQMAIDYHPQAVLERAGQRYVGRAALVAYFATVPSRLQGARVEQTILRVNGNRVMVGWRLVGGGVDGVTGTDTYTVENGQIIRQVVALADGDF